MACSSVPEHRAALSSAEQLKCCLVGVVRLTEDGDTGLHQDVVLGHLRNLLGHVRVADAAVGGGEILIRDRQVLDCRLDSILDRTQVGLNRVHPV